MARETTITLDDDLAERLDEQRRKGVSVDAALNEAIRDVLERLGRESTPRKPFVVRPFSMGKPLIDLTCTGRAIERLDELERQ
jgi:Arc/MetJ-type ribon-helix-helix transcriptional regulator